VTQATLHSLYVWKLSKELQKEYDQVVTNIPVLSEGRLQGEIDILAYRDGEAHAFEVKRSFRPTKARMQLRKVKDNFSEPIARFFLYAADADKVLELDL
jgi:hypothetical protein